MDLRTFDAERLDSDLLRFTPPSFDEATLNALVARLWGLEGRLTPLAGERDQNNLLTTPRGERFVLKVAGADEPAEISDFQNRALLHIERVAPDLPVPRLIRTREGQPSGTIEGPDGRSHVVRLVSYLPGVPVRQCPPLSLAALHAIGRLQARLVRALAGFFHPAAGHFMPWDLRNGLLGAPGLEKLLGDEVARLAGPALGRLNNEVLPRLEGLRAQVIHNDLHVANLLCEPERGEAISGIIDFGDMIHGQIALDLAVTLAGFYETDRDPVASASALVTGFHQVLALEADEIDLLYDLTLGRLIQTVALFRLRLRDLGTDRAPAFLAEELPHVVAGLRRLAAVDRIAFAERLRADAGLGPITTGWADDESLIARRRRVLAPTYEHFYRRPLHLVRGEGVWLYDAAGRAYLDCYNNVPSVGHCHPHVVAALTRQARTLNTHTRYLHQTILDYAEKLTATLPEPLSVALLVCTGTEAVDLAWRIARTVTGAKGAIVFEHAYHGGSIAAAELSTAEYPPEERPPHVEAVAAPDPYRGPFGADHPDLAGAYAGLVDEAIARLAARGHRPAMFICDAIFDSQGVLTAPAGYLAAVSERVRAAGGLLVADEVQSGLCRLGEHVWGFEDSGVVPDIVAMGKPIGDGHPLGAVVTTPEIAARFARATGYFNTFGGNPVSAAVGLAVLEVIEAEDLLARVARVGAHFGAGLAALAERHAAIGQVRGKGLFWGVDLVRDRATREPWAEGAREVVEGMRERGVLIAAIGPGRNVLKIRPPLVLSEAEADRALAALDETLATLAAAPDLA